MDRVDLLLHHAKIWTGGATIPGADAVAVRDGRVVAVGRSGDLAPRAARTIDARGATLTPGLVDAHLHLVPWARGRDEVDLGGAGTRDEVVARVAAHHRAHPGAGALVGRGWDARGWTGPPHRAALDAVSTERPIVLHSRDFHNVWANGAALRAAGIDHARRDPPGGTIERDASGEPTGLLREGATRLCTDLEAAGRDSAAALAAGMRTLLAAGVTTVHDFEGAETMQLVGALRHGPRVRVVAHVRDAGFEQALALGLRSGFGDDWLRIGALKLFADGTLGSRTAALLEPYDGTDGAGEDLIAPDELRTIVGRAFGAGLSVAVHAIGDRACRHTLDAFAAHAGEIPGLAMPPRIEHLQLVDRADLPRFAALGVAASVQPTHCTSDIELAERWWSGRLDRAYPWRSLRSHGAMLAFGSDAPVEPPSPAHGLHAAVTRRRPGETRAFTPAERVTLDEALSAYTEGPARLAGTWPRFGTIAPGAVADLVVWDRDLHRAPADELCEARAACTVVDGEVVHESAASPARAEAT